MNCCRPEQVDPKEHGNMLKRIQILEDGRVPAKEAKTGKLKEKKENNEERVSEAMKKVTPIREYQAVHEENFISSWLREGQRRQKKKRKKWIRKSGKDVGKKRKESQREKKMSGCEEEMCEPRLRGGP